MKVNLTQPELEAAVSQYLQNIGMNTDGQELTINFTQTRKPPSTTAEVEINPIADQSPTNLGDVFPDD